MAKKLKEVKPSIDDKYKDRIERHENELRAANQIIQSLKADKEFLKTQIDELKNKTE